METVNIHKIIVGQLSVNCYVVYDDASLQGVVIDPGDEPERIGVLIDNYGIRPEHIILTHAHYDHVCAAGELKNKYGSRLVMHNNEKSVYELTKEKCLVWGFESADFPQPDILVNNGDRISIGSGFLEVIHTPGHTPGGICLLGEKTLFTGDTLFKGSVGRTDLPGGNTEQLLGSLKKIAALPPETRVLCGHGDETTIEIELRHNPFLNVETKFRFF
jgi:glyoxylase-like metal-dependent hydrolase (beta-lactamase superfamily II)